MNWVLIIFIYLYGTGPSNPNIMTVVNMPGFYSEELCHSAAQKTIDVLFQPNLRRDPHTRYVCVRQQ